MNEFKIVKASELKSPPNHIKVHHDGDITIEGPGMGYWIERSRFDSTDKILHWALHLSAKSWVDNYLIYCFIKAACLEHDINPYGKI